MDLSNLVQNKKREDSTVSFGSESFQQNILLKVIFLCHKLPKADLAGGEISLNPEVLDAFNCSVWTNR